LTPIQPRRVVDRDAVFVSVAPLDYTRFRADLDVHELVEFELHRLTSNPERLPSKLHDDPDNLV
jgi:hypothetical protein